VGIQFVIKSLRGFGGTFRFKRSNVRFREILQAENLALWSLLVMLCEFKVQGLA
jgi:hypothetical protein